jgi:hypothetical protein
MRVREAPERERAHDGADARGEQDRRRRPHRQPPRAGHEGQDESDEEVVEELQDHPERRGGDQLVLPPGESGLRVESVEHGVS